MGLLQTTWLYGHPSAYGVRPFLLEPHLGSTPNSTKSDWPFPMDHLPWPLRHGLWYALVVNSCLIANGHTSPQQQPLKKVSYSGGLKTCIFFSASMTYGSEMVKYHLMSSWRLYTGHDNLVQVLIRHHMIKILYIVLGHLLSGWHGRRILI